LIAIEPNEFIAATFAGVMGVFQGDILIWIANLVHILSAPISTHLEFGYRINPRLISESSFLRRPKAANKSKVAYKRRIS
jgi:hypothetical protein